jgi:hypothetical protein
MIWSDHLAASMSQASRRWLPDDLVAQCIVRLVRTALAGQESRPALAVCALAACRMASHGVPLGASACVVMLYV